jgi:hypothetical protein
MNVFAKPLAIAAVLIASVSMARAGAWPEVDDVFLLKNYTVLYVAKVKVQGDVDNSLVCLRRTGGSPQSCIWRKVGDLREGNWLIYEGTLQGKWQEN